MADNKLRCCVVLRLDNGSTSTMVAKYDHAGATESHQSGALYGGNDKTYADAIQEAVSKDPPGGLSNGFGGFKVVQSDEYQLVYGADKEGCCIAVVTGLRYPSRIAIKMLQELHIEFSAKFAQDFTTAPTNSLSKKTKTLLAEKCTKYEDPKNVDKAQSVLGQVEKVRGQMGDNIAGMLKNTEKAETLAEKSDQLNEQANVFKKRSGDLKKEMRWKNLKMTLILGGLVVGILLVILVPLIIKAKNAAKGN